MYKQDFNQVGKNVAKVDGLSLITGKAIFVDDFEIKDMLHAKVLRSPHAHAIITDIDISLAEKAPGVKAVLCYKNFPRVLYTTAGQGHPEPSPYDTALFDNKMRFVGDRVAAVAAETPEEAEDALKLIKVKYKVLKPVLSLDDALNKNAPVIHDEKDATGIFDVKRNIAAHVKAEVGSVEKSFKEADFVIENTYDVPYITHAQIEPHITITYFDEHERLTIIASTQVPFHVRRIVSRILNLPVGKVRVIKPRIGGGFGGKQEILTEDICAALTFVSKKPVRFELTREEEMCASRTRHPQRIIMKTGVNKNGKLVANKMTVIANTGAYGSHALTVPCNTGSKSLPLYPCPNIYFEATTYYTNLPVGGACRGYGGPQGYFAMECHMDDIATKLGLDRIEFRKKNIIKSGDLHPLSEALGEGKEGVKQIIKSSGMFECIDKGMQAIGWNRKNKPSAPHKKRGLGVAFIMHGSGIPCVDMGAVSIKMNEDGSFNLLMGATDLGTGSDTILAQIAAEALCVDTDKFIVYSSDTDLTPFDVGAYASSTTYITGQAVLQCALKVKEQILNVAAKILKEDVKNLECKNGKIISEITKKEVSYSEICLYSLYQNDQFQIMDTASAISYECPPPFGTQWAEVEVDTRTGKIDLLKFVSCIDCGTAINPLLAEGQIEGGVHMGIGYGLSEELTFDKFGKTQQKSFLDYKMLTADEMPKMETYLISTYEPTGPYGAKSVSEIPVDGPAPAIANAVFDAVGVRVKDIPITSEKLFWAMKKGK